MTAPLLAAMTEDDLLVTVLAYAKQGNWLAHHVRPARTKGARWVSPVMGDVGFPDVVLVHKERGLVVFAELKREGAYPAPDQRRWLKALGESDCGDGLTVTVWRPRDLDAIFALLCPEHVRNG